MEIEFANDQLALIETDRAADTKLPVAVIQTARQRLSVMRAAPDIKTMRNWKSLGFGSRDGSMNEHAVAVTPQWSMVLRVEEKNSCMKIIVTGLEEQLQGAA
jgi:proteic killer suppression protein